MVWMFASKLNNKDKVIGMALTKCPECGKEVSNKAEKCIHCGYPLNSGGENRDFGTEKKEEKKQKNIKENLQMIKKNRKAMTFVSIAFLIVIFLIIFFTNFSKAAMYNKATSAYEKGNYKKAAKYYSYVGVYKDAAYFANDSTNKYNFEEGIKLIDKEKWDEAEKHFFECKDYSNSKDYLNLCIVKQAEVLMEEKRYSEASNMLFPQQNYTDARGDYQICEYYLAIESEDSGDLQKAALHYKNAANYNGSASKIIEIGEKYVESEKYDEALEIFEYYPNSSELSSNKAYDYVKGQKCIVEGDYENAALLLEKALDYRDAEDLYIMASYECGLNAFKDRDYVIASEWLSKASGYKDADDILDGCKLSSVKVLVNQGNLNQAKEILDTIDDDIEYNGLSARTYKELLEKNIQWVQLCGKWILTGGQMRVTQSGSYYNHWWYCDFDEGERNLEVRCAINDDGRVFVNLKGDISVYTSYSSLASLLTQGTVSVNTSQNMSSLGTAKIDDYTSMTLSKSGITINYKRNDRSQDVYFTYVYKTDATYGKRTEAY